MKREYKFRGKRVNNGEWVYGNVYEEDEKFFILTNLLDSSNVINNGLLITDQLFYPIGYQVVPETVGQFTDLYDNSTPPKEIYEGDVVKAKIYNGEITGVIEYDIPGSRFQISEIHEGESGWNYHNICDDFILEVIGNIFDTPGLGDE